MTTCLHCLENKDHYSHEFQNPQLEGIRRSLAGAFNEAQSAVIDALGFDALSLAGQTRIKIVEAKEALIALDIELAKEMCK